MPKSVKYCNRCKRDLCKTNFTKAKSRYDGLQGYCSDCMKKYRKEHYYNNQKAYKDRSDKAKEEIRKLIRKTKDVPCMDCGIHYVGMYWVMDFDHRPKELKVSNVAQMVSNGSIGQVKLEIDKCDVVCANCHRTRTHNRLEDLDC